MDMVYVKDSDSNHIYEKGIEIVEKDGCLYANKTTLGADNGIAVAYCLAVLDTDEIKHPDLEVIMTTQEEAGMVGVQGINTDDIKGKYFINFDTEEEGVFFTGCAGGVRNYLRIPINRENIESECIISIKISGLKSGHSGMEIDMGRGNAIKLMGRLLYNIDSDVLHLCSIISQGKANVISNNSKAVIVVPISKKAEIIHVVKELEKTFKQELQFTDNIKIDINEESSIKNDFDSYTQETKNKIINLLMLIPYGVIDQNYAIQGLVQTSMNVGSLEESGNKISLLNFIRISVESEKYNVADNVRIIADTYGVECEFFNDYPQWEYKQQSKIRDMVTDIYEEIHHKRPIITAVHAGLECGYFDKKLKDVDMISFGPNQYEVHTTKEHISIQSIKNVWALIVKLLERLAEEN